MFITRVNKLCKSCSIEKEHTVKGKVCIDCKQAYDKKYVELNKEKLKAAGLEYRHRADIKNKKTLYDKEYREQNKDKKLANRIKRKISGASRTDYRKSHFKNTYGITIEDYELMLQQQEGKCKICKTTEFTGVGNCLHVDHCHITGKVRGLLCMKCNNGLGNFKDNIKTLHNAITYLTLHNI